MKLSVSSTFLFPLFFYWWGKGMYFWKCTQKRPSFVWGWAWLSPPTSFPLTLLLSHSHECGGVEVLLTAHPLPFFHSLWVGEEFSTDMVFKLQHPESWILSRDWHGKDPIRLRVLNRTINLLGESQVLKLRAPSLTFISKTTNQLLFFFPRLHLCWWFPLVLKCRETLKCFYRVS